MNNTKINDLISFIEEEAKKQNRPTSSIMRCISEAFAATPWKNYEPGTIFETTFDEYGGEVFYKNGREIKNITDLIARHIYKKECDSEYFYMIDKIISCKDEDIQLINKNTFTTETTNGGYHFSPTKTIAPYVTARCSKATPFVSSSTAKAPQPTTA